MCKVRAGAAVTAIRDFVRTAQRSGAEATYEVARAELDDRDLGRLLLHLRRVEPGWRPRPKERRRLAARLLQAGVSDKDIVEQTTISRTTVWRIRRDLVNPSDSGRKAALQSGGNVSNRPPSTYGSTDRVAAPLAFSATSGNHDDRALRLLLNHAGPEPRR
jgi:hypothetical protein